MQIDTVSYQRALGEELRRLRKQRGWTRKELNRRLQTEISLQTLATYELGTRQCSVVRLVEICNALDVPAHEVLARVHDRVLGGLTNRRVRINLIRMASDGGNDLLPLRRWAADQLDRLAPGTSPEVHLDLPALRFMAELCRMPTGDLVRRLQEINSPTPVGGAAPLYGRAVGHAVGGPARAVRPVNKPSR
ncbi:helix-turn-helix domain-containing protein [Goodfellowiella coeruleoviolacea]|uniref:Helix-turn-helix domain-containing protein n=1 Tax=Goodfellowiella coeruleoviolacea TaxID=334858 RepID=A0AAE3GBU7_9PSEU|nr:helix-turn-helix transcriptional regulator [Goodfellowiella coeruleoviolacea]MCP2164943.1 Helix-turn-helix domain-containing protein [Goodfellowiella coeruleoviolacea]